MVHTTKDETTSVSLSVVFHRKKAVLREINRGVKNRGENLSGNLIILCASFEEWTSSPRLGYLLCTCVPVRVRVCTRVPVSVYVRVYVYTCARVDVRTPTIEY